MPDYKTIGKMLQGVMLVFDGPDGTGKTSQLSWFEAQLRAAGHKSVTRVREPGGTPFGEAVRSLALQGTTAASPLAEANLFTACRIELLDNVIIPALNQERIVLVDRFTASTYAYQGVNLHEDDQPALDNLILAAESRVQGRWLNVLFAGDPKAMYHRMLDRKGDRLDNIEARGYDYFERVCARFGAYLGTAHREARSRVAIEGKTPTQVADGVAECVMAMSYSLAARK